MKDFKEIKEYKDIDTYYDISNLVEEIFVDRVEAHKHLIVANKENKRLNNIINKTKKYIKENILSFNEVDMADIKIILDMLEDKW